MTNIKNDYTTKLSLKCTINQNIIINFIVNVSMQILLKSTFPFHIPLLISIIDFMQSTSQYKISNFKIKHFKITQMLSSKDKRSLPLNLSEINQKEYQ